MNGETIDISCALEKKLPAETQRDRSSLNRWNLLISTHDFELTSNAHGWKPENEKLVQGIMFSCFVCSFPVDTVRCLFLNSTLYRCTWLEQECACWDEKIQWDYCAYTESKGQWSVNHEVSMKGTFVEWTTVVSFFSYHNSIYTYPFNLSCSDHYFVLTKHILLYSIPHLSLQHDHCHIP